MKADLVVRSRRVVSNGAVSPAAIIVTNGKIQAIAPVDAEIAAGAEIQAGDSIVMPGLVDTHVHINEPGRADWEGFDTATRAAAAGGVTCLIEMPLNSVPPTTSANALGEKLRRAEKHIWVDVGFWGGVVPRNAGALNALFVAGAFGFKCFLVPSGVPEFEHVSEADLHNAMPVLAKLGALLLVHAELPGPIEEATVSLQSRSPASYSTWLGSRPRAAENEAIALLVRLARQYRTRIHVVHVSSAEALACLRQARNEGLAVTAETCPHYLTLAAEDISEGATEFKCAPPIREQANQRQLWAGLEEGVLSTVVSDHSPCPPAMKCRNSGDFFKAWGGIASLELGLPVMWTAASERGFMPQDLARWMCAQPSHLVGLEHRKGAIAPGRDADLVIWAPEQRFCVEPARLQQRHKVTPYAGRTLRGVVEMTLLRGNIVFDRGKFAATPKGQTLLRGQA